VLGRVTALDIFVGGIVGIGREVGNVPDGDLHFYRLTSGPRNAVGVFQKAGVDDDFLAKIVSAVLVLLVRGDQAALGSGIRTDAGFGGRQRAQGKGRCRGSDYENGAKGGILRVVVFGGAAGDPHHDAGGAGGGWWCWWCFFLLLW